MARLHAGFDRRPLQVTTTWVGCWLRTTTVLVGTEAGQSWLDQIRSLPEVILTTRECGETAKLHAGRMPVSCRRSGTRRPAAARVRSAVTVISSTAHGPVGAASTSGFPVAVARGVAAPRVPSGRSGTGPSTARCVALAVAEGAAEVPAEVPAERTAAVVAAPS